MRGLPARAASICAATAVAGAVTAANRAGWLDRAHLAASPRAVAEGKLWLLLTSGVIADRPWLPSLLGFAIYGFLGAADAVDHGAFAQLLDRPDVGLSAIIAAWIGVVSYVFWRRYPSRRAHILNALGCVGCALIGFAFRPDVTALDSEHLVAFALGAAIAAWWSPPRAPAAPREDDLDRELQELLRAS